MKAAVVLQLLVFVNGIPTMALEADYPSLTHCEQSKHLAAVRAGKMFDTMYPGASIVIRGWCRTTDPEGSQA